MTKSKKIAKKALKHPELFSQGELAYFNLWLKARKDRKAKEKTSKQ